MLAMQTTCLMRPVLPCAHNVRISSPVQSACSTSCGHLQARRCLSQPRRQRGAALVVRMGIKAIESFDAAFELSDECRDALTGYLSSESFCQQVARETKLEVGRKLKFADILFQPVPWSVQTKKGMPVEYERYLEDPEYVFINVPPNFMFKAKIFKPSRLCAIFKTA